MLDCVTVPLLYQLCAERGQMEQQGGEAGEPGHAAAWEMGWADQRKEMEEVRVG